MDELKAAARCHSRVQHALEVRRDRLSRKAEEDIIALFVHGVAPFGSQRDHDVLERKVQLVALHVNLDKTTELRKETFTA